MYVGTDEGWISGQPRRGDLATGRRWQRVGVGTLPEPPGRPDRGRPVELADRLRGVRRLRCGHARQQRTRVRDVGRREALEQHHGEPAGRARSTRSSSTRPTRRRSTSAPTSAPFMTHQRRPKLASAGQRRCPRWACGSSTTTPRNGVLAAGTHGRGAYTLTSTATRAGTRGVEDRLGHPGRTGQHDRLHDHGAEHRQRRRDGRERDRPAAGEHDARDRSATAASSAARRGAAGTGKTVPAGGSITLHFDGADQGQRCRRSVTRDRRRRDRRQGRHGASRRPAARTPRRSRRRSP